VVDRCEVGVRKATEQSSLALEQPGRPAVVSAVGVEQLERQQSPELAILGQIQLARIAGGQLDEHVEALRSELRRVARRCHRRRARRRPCRCVTRVDFAMLAQSLTKKSCQTMLTFWAMCAELSSIQFAKSRLIQGPCRNSLRPAEGR